MEKLFSKIKKETLSAEEKAKIFYSLRDFVAQNPVRSIKSPFYEMWFILGQRTIVVPTAIVLVFILVTGTVFAAGNSLPGSTLYPVKMLRENVESLVATNTKSKAQIEATHAISRLQEVEQMVTSGGQLDTNVRKQIESDFESQVKNATNHINKLRDGGDGKDASKIRSDFKSLLTEHEKTITELSNSTSTKIKTREELSNVISNIRSRIEDASNEDGHKSRKPDNENH
ncbi:MAG: DUF5667 domain-containing protein [Candidatus Zambryskibacteria bacterium]